MVTVVVKAPPLIVAVPSSAALFGPPRVSVTVPLAGKAIPLTATLLPGVTVGCPTLSRAGTSGPGGGVFVTWNVWAQPEQPTRRPSSAMKSHPRTDTTYDVPGLRL